MAIGANATVWYQGTEATVSAAATTSSVASAAYSIGADADEWTNSDDAPYASFVLKSRINAQPATSGGIQLMCNLKNIGDTTGDELDVATGSTGHFLGNFVTGASMNSTSTDYYFETGPVELPMKTVSQVYEFYLLNSCGQALTAGWTLKITPMAYGPNTA